MVKPLGELCDNPIRPATVVHADAISRLLKAGLVLTPSIAHGTLNGSAGLAVVLLQVGNDLLIGMTGLAGVVAFAAANLLLWVWRRRHVTDPVSATG